MKKQKESEFGRGLVICLVKFAEHAERWHQWFDTESALEGFNESHRVEMFFSGASDHLYDIKIPKQWKGTPIDRKVKELQNFGLMIGHGFSGRTHTREDIDTAFNLCREIALLIDKALGLNADIGQW